MTHEEFIDRYLIDKPHEIKDGILYIHTELDLYSEEITSLPDNLYFKEILDLEKALITKLPENLHVEEWLDINETQITHLPDSIYINHLWYDGDCINKQITCSEMIQLDLISRSEHALERFINPTEKAIALHKLLYKI